MIGDMNPTGSAFFNFDLRQQVNQWLCIVLISLMCFFVVLYYLVNKTEAFGNEYVAATATAASY